MYDVNDLLDELRSLTHRPREWTDLKTAAPIINLDDYADRLRPGATADEHSRADFLDHPDHIHLATGHTIRYDGQGTDIVEPWTGVGAFLVEFGDYQRYHQPGIHRTASIDPLAVVDPTAHLEPGTRIEAGAVIGPHVHIGANTTIGALASIEGGTYIGQRSTIGSQTRIGPGACIRPDTTIGRKADIGAASEVHRHVQLPNHARLGAGEHATLDRHARNVSNPYRVHQLTNAVERALQLDHG